MCGNLVSVFFSKLAFCKRFVPHRGAITLSRIPLDGSVWRKVDHSSHLVACEEGYHCLSSKCRENVFNEGSTSFFQCSGTELLAA